MKLRDQPCRRDFQTRSIFIIGESRSFGEDFPMESTHSKTIGYILWIFGFTGAHRFYFGKPVS